MMGILEDLLTYFCRLSAPAKTTPEAVPGVMHISDLLPRYPLPLRRIPHATRTTEVPW